jgi:hypothetical protein
MLCEVFESFGGPKAEAAEDGQCGVAHGGEHLRRMTDVGSRLILAARDVADSKDRGRYRDYRHTVI